MFPRRTTAEHKDMATCARATAKGKALKAGEWSARPILGLCRTMAPASVHRSPFRHTEDRWNSHSASVPEVFRARGKRPMEQANIYMMPSSGDLYLHLSRRSITCDKKPLRDWIPQPPVHIESTLSSMSRPSFSQQNMYWVPTTCQELLWAKGQHSKPDKYRVSCPFTERDNRQMYK